MNRYRDLYNAKYKTIRSLGWSGWGSENREEEGIVLLERILASKYVPNNGKGLELGCGEGQLSRKLALHGFNMSAADISDTALKWAREKTVGTTGSINYFQVDIAEENVDLGGPYDLIVDGNCLHCIPGEKRDTFYTNVRNALADGGIFFVSCRCSKLVSSTVFDSGLKYRYFGTVSEVLTELIQAGFATLDHTEYDRGEQVHLDVVTKNSVDKNQSVIMP